VQESGLRRQKTRALALLGFLQARLELWLKEFGLSSFAQTDRF
jgi:hypothetical protein